MENQRVSIRDEAGRIAKGHSLNPNGKPRGVQNFVDRARYLCEKHTIDGVIQLVSDKKEFGKLSVFDGMIVMRIAEAVERDGKDSMNALLDRMIGKPIQHAEIKTETKVVGFEELASMANAIVNRLTPPAMIDVTPAQKPIETMVTDVLDTNLELEPAIITNVLSEGDLW